METGTTPEADNPTPNPQAKPATESSGDASQSASTLVEKHRKQRADKGQPRAKRSGAVQEPNQSNAPSNPAVALNLELVEKSITALIGTLDSMMVRKVYTKAVKIGVPQDDSKGLAETVQISVSEKEVVSKCTAAIVARSQFLTEHAPEAMLCCFAVSYGVRLTTVLYRLDELEKVLAEKKKKNESGV